jgi:TPR repeat protein
MSLSGWPQGTGVIGLGLHAFAAGAHSAKDLPGSGPVRCFLLAFLLVLSSLHAGAMQASPAAPKPANGRRLALVIGNSRYRDSPLVNPANDATAIARALRELGFSVTAMVDASLAQMTDAARQFGDQLERGDVGLFFFAGHGMQIKGRNFLIPVDADIKREDEVQYKSFDANQVLDKMESARNAINIVILDACRNNPFARSFRSANSGLAQMDAPVGTYISFATGPGKVASDGTGGNGLFTQHLLTALKTPNLKVEEVFKQVRTQVMKDSKGQQVPWDSSSLTGDFWFQPAAASALPTAPAALQAAVQAPAGAVPTDRELPPPATMPKGKPTTTPSQLSVAEAPGGVPPAAAEPVKPAGRSAQVKIHAEESFHRAQEADKRNDAKAAFDQYATAAELGHAAAQLNLGLLFKLGRPPARQDLAAARKWFHKAAEQGQTVAQYELGKLLAAGQGGPKDCREAQRWLLKACASGHLDAMVQAAGLLQRGCDGDRNPVEAARWLKIAAGRGSRDAQFSLGVLYFNGEGVPQDPKEAARWLKAAAAQGHPSTKLYLARLE